MSMNNVRIHVESYLGSDSVYPFFLVVGDNEYIAVQEELSALGFDIVGVSGYCGSPDRGPNIDTLKDELKIGGNKAIIGLGEYLSLRGKTDAFGTQTPQPTSFKRKQSSAFIALCN